MLKHIEVYQSIISRMAANSSSCKQWCVALVTAVLAFVAEQDKAGSAYLAFVPIVLFGFLDFYYLALEKQFREAFTVTTNKVRDGRFHLDDLYVIAATGKLPLKKHLRGAIVSHSVWPFYLATIVVTVAAAKYA
ncbi:MAG: hypothetical protein ACFCUG_14705 [Thiotrichales bacterium]